MKIHSNVDDALSFIKSGQKIFVHGAAATPHSLIKGLVDVLPQFKDLEIMHLHTHGNAEYAQEKYKDNCRVTNLFVAGNMRKYLDYDRVDYLPCFLSEIPKLLAQGPRKINVALIHVSTPGPMGFCSLGTSVDVTNAAIEAADIVIAQINKQMPKVHGDAFLHISKIDHAVEVDCPLDELPVSKISEIEKKIGINCAGIIEDGSCLQTDIVPKL